MARQQIHHLRIRDASSMLWNLQPQLIQVGVENNICYSDSGDCNDIPLLQRLLGVDRSSIVLSINRLLPNRDVHCSEKDTKVFFHMGMAENIELDLFDRITCCSCWIHPGTCH
uniref:Amino acid transporter n=1 Tax=Solanum tuberosum TaxID=4113 RepID=M1A1P0_SOLTU